MSEEPYDAYPWQDAYAAMVEIGARVEQIEADRVHGALSLRIGALGTVVGYALTRVRVRFDGENEPVTVRPGLLAVVEPRLQKGHSSELATPLDTDEDTGSPEPFPQSLAARHTSGGMEAREAHLFPIPDPAAGVPEELRAYCGTTIQPGEAELLKTVFAGAPCMGCLSRASSPSTPTP